ncbi:GNAT family N-acetyltransferase [Burkholderia territorii]|uniref:GNAT family N-acetyltransferase n=1 Tax=Burkholderia territorii TaxID=1503055 RepID=UPI0012DA0849|nr:GNAT family N-acetyltransferase [Burkholderia territorii]
MRSTVIDRELWLKDSERFGALAEVARSNLEAVSSYYPDFGRWYAGKVTPGLYSGERKVLFREISGTLAAVAIVKDASEEKKLCCLRVMPAFQGSGLGIKMFEEAFELLETNRPLLTVAEEKLPQFERVFDYFNFERGGKYLDFYRKNKAEYSFNGVLFVPAT